MILIEAELASKQYDYLMMGCLPEVWCFGFFEALMLIGFEQLIYS